MELGIIKKGHELGLKCANAHILHACENCGKERWVQLVGGVPRKRLCLMCSIHSPERNEKVSKGLMGRTISSNTRKKISRTKRFNFVKKKLEQDIKEYMKLCPAKGKPDEQTIRDWAEMYGFNDNGTHNGWVRELIEKATAGISTKKRESSFELYGGEETRVPQNNLGDYIPSEMVGICDE